MTQVTIRDMAVQIKRLTLELEVEKTLTNAALRALLKSEVMSDKSLLAQLNFLDEKSDENKELAFYKECFAKRLESVGVKPD